MEISQYKVKHRKNFPHTTGVYMISFENCDTGRVYIGSASRVNLLHPKSSGFKSRWRTHILSLKKSDKQSTWKLQRAYNKYGEENMIFTIIEEVPSEKCVEREQYYIDYYNSYDNGYNSRKLANSNLGVRHSLESRKRQSIRLKNKMKPYIDPILIMYKRGDRPIDISKALGLSVSTIHRVLKNSGIILSKKIPHVGTAVFQYDLAGNLIGQWKSIRACSRDLKLNQKTIVAALKSEEKVINGYILTHQTLDTTTNT